MKYFAWFLMVVLLFTAAGGKWGEAPSGPMPAVPAGETGRGDFTVSGPELGDEGKEFSISEGSSLTISLSYIDNPLLNGYGATSVGNDLSGGFSPRNAFVFSEENLFGSRFEPEVNLNEIPEPSTGVLVGLGILIWIIKEKGGTNAAHARKRPG